MRLLLLRPSLSLLSILAATSLAGACSGGSGTTGSSKGTGGHPAGSGGSGGSGGTGGGAPSSAVEPRFSLPESGVPYFLDVPFPSDLYVGANGRIGTVPALAGYLPAGASQIVAGLAPLDGFGLTAGAIFAVDDVAANGAPAAIDLSTLPADEAATMAPTATALLVDLDAADPTKAVIPARVEYQDDSSIGGKARPLVTVAPARGIVLPEQHHIVAVLTTGIRTKDARAVSPSAGFRAIRDGATRTTAAEKLYGDAVDKVVKLAPALADKSKIAVLAVYRTQTTSHELVDLRGQLTKLPSPTLSWAPADLAPIGAGLFMAAPLQPGFVSLDAWLGQPAKLPDGSDDPATDDPNGRAHDAIAAIGTAVFNAPNLLIEDPMGDYNNPAHHTFARDASGAPIINPAKPTSKIWISFALPKSKMPTGGFPVVLAQHGLGGDRSTLLAFANTFAEQGWATVAIESVTFGARAAEPASTADATAGFPWSGGAGAYDGPDGFVDMPNGSTDFFGSLLNLGSMRDQMRQSVLDLGTALDLLASPSLDLSKLAIAVPGAKFDSQRIAFIGNSLGGIMGSMVAALEPRVKTFVLNVPGGGLMTEVASSSPMVASSLQVAAQFNFGISSARFTPGHPLVQLLQHVVDAGDPLVFARHIVTDPATVNGALNPAKNVLAIEVLSDEWVSNQANEALARAAGFPLAEPNVGAITKVPLGTAKAQNGVVSNAPLAGLTAVVVQVGPAVHGQDYYAASGQHTHAFPFPRFDQADPFPTLPTPFSVKQPYLPIQAMAVAFLAGAFAGSTPEVKGFPAPVLDYDGDGVPDAMDAFPNDPTMH